MAGNGNQDKIKPVLNGAAETMLQSFYARAMYSKNPKHKFKDEKAEEIVAKLDYDFSKASKDNTMSAGVIARTVVFDELVSDFIKKNPDCTVVNIACGLDTRLTERLPGIIWICRKPLQCGIRYIVKRAEYPQLDVRALIRRGQNR